MSADLPIGIRCMIDGVAGTIEEYEGLPRAQAETVAEIMARKTYAVEMIRYGRDKHTAAKYEELAEASTIVGLEQWIAEKTKREDTKLPKLSSRETIAEMANQLHLPREEALDVAKAAAKRVEDD